MLRYSWTNHLKVVHMGRALFEPNCATFKGFYYDKLRPLYARMPPFTNNKPLGNSQRFVVCRFAYTRSSSLNISGASLQATHTRIPVRNLIYSLLVRASMTSTSCITSM